MTYTINSLAFAPTHCDDDLFKPRGCRVSFSTSEHGEVEINVGSAEAEPTDIFVLVSRAGSELAQRFPQYASAIESMLPE